MSHRIDFYPDNRYSSSGRFDVKPWGVNENNNVHYSQIALPWMTAVRKDLAYNSDNLRFEQRVGRYWQKRNAYFPEGHYANRLYETVMGKLLHDYLKKQNPDISVLISSNHDDIFAGCDYVISNGDQCVRVDLAISTTNKRNFNKNNNPLAIVRKAEKFFRTPGIPEEYFATMKPDIKPRPLPLIIVRIDGSMFDQFVHDFFQTITVQNTYGDVLEYFSDWMGIDSSVTRGRVAYLLGYVNNPSEKGFVNDITNQIGILLAGIKGVSTIVQ
ncbi:MAG: hypothetical protein PHH70_00885 [Candidatus Gracilibacteria bacterium]|nr:hypothetical protein [Candidatus Gracilibacteria bacterium]